MEEIRCAVIGIGTMGKRYASILNSHAVNGLILTAVCGRSEASRTWARDNLSGDVLICADEDELYAHQNAFDAVLVATPHKLHPAMTIRALSAGKHVMCDKPAGVTAADAAAMAECADHADKVYGLMCHQRTYAGHRKLKQLLDDGALGEITRVNLVNSRFFRTKFYHRSGSWRSSWSGEGGGALINQGYHLLDLWQWLFGLPDSLYADIPFGKYNDFRVDDEATLVMDYPGKMTGTFILSTGEGNRVERLEVAGTRGCVILDGKTLTFKRFNADTREYAETAQVTDRQGLLETEQRFVFTDEGDAYETMLHNFAAAVRGEAKLIAPGRDGVNTLMLINAAYLSAWEERKLSLPVDMNRYRTALRCREEDETGREKRFAYE